MNGNSAKKLEDIFHVNDFATLDSIHELRDTVEYHD